MTEKYNLIDYLLKSMIELLIDTYHVKYEWAIDTVLKSSTYKQLLEDKKLRNEGDLFIFEQLQKELQEANILPC